MVARKEVFDVEKTTCLVGLEIPEDLKEVDDSIYPTVSEIQDYLSDLESNPEQSIIVGEVVSALGETLSNDAMLILGCLLSDPSASNHALAQLTKIPFKKVCLARYEIMRGYSAFSTEISDPVIEGKQPIYLRADQIC